METSIISVRLAPTLAATWKYGSARNKGSTGVQRWRLPSEECIGIQSNKVLSLASPTLFRFAIYCMLESATNSIKHAVHSAQTEHAQSWWSLWTVEETKDIECICMHGALWTLGIDCMGLPSSPLTIWHDEQAFFSFSVLLLDYFGLHPRLWLNT